MGWCDSGFQWKNLFSYVRTAHRGPQCEVVESKTDNGPLLCLHYTKCGAHSAQPGKGPKVSTVMQRLQETTVISAELHGRA